MLPVSACENTTMQRKQGTGSRNFSLAHLSFERIARFTTFTTPTAFPSANENTVGVSECQFVHQEGSSVNV